MKKILNEFKKFISKGNALDLAVGVVVVGAGVHAERTEELGKGDEQQRLVGED